MRSPTRLIVRFLLLTFVISPDSALALRYLSPEEGPQRSGLEEALTAGLEEQDQAFRDAVELARQP